MRLKITGKLEWENREQPQPVRQLPTGSTRLRESRKRGEETRNGDDGRESVVVVYMREWERRAAIPGTLKRNKESSYIYIYMYIYEKGE